MDAGKAIELGEPLKLLGDSESNFSKLVAYSTKAFSFKMFLYVFEL
jgi:hypothetical protein